MKILNYPLAAAVAFTLVMSSVSAQAQSRDSDRKPSYQSSQKHQLNKPQPGKKRWTRGQKVSNWKSRSQVKDYKRYGLAAPQKGQQWVKIDNDYLLVTLATGVIVGIANGR